MIYKDMTNSDYHSHPAISSSAVKTVAKSTIAHWLGQERRETSAMALGSAVHSLTLEPHLGGTVRGPETRRGNAWKDAVAEAKTFNPDAIVLPEAEFDEIEKIAASARAHPVMQDYLEHQDSKIEMSIVLTDPDYGFELRARPDLYCAKNGMMIDLKSTIDASPRGFARSAAQFGYFTQAAFYRRVLTLEGLPVSDFIFLAVEKDAPYATCAHAVSPEGMAYGEAQMHKALEKIARYKDTGEISTGWPDMVTLSPPAWVADVVSD